VRSSVSPASETLSGEPCRFIGSAPLSPRPSSVHHQSSCARHSHEYLSSSVCSSCQTAWHRNVVVLAVRNERSKLVRGFRASNNPRHLVHCAGQAFSHPPLAVSYSSPVGWKRKSPRKSDPKISWLLSNGDRGESGLDRPFRILMAHCVCLESFKATR
jgi:hypothetical protein